MNTSNTPNDQSSILNQPPQNSSSSSPKPSPRKKEPAKTIPTEMDLSLTPSEQFRLKTNLMKGLGPSIYQSSSTLQNSILSVSFSKAQRFSGSRKPHPSADSMHSSRLVSTLDQRATGIGYGNKGCYPGHILKIAAENPAPNNYYIKSEWDEKNKGRSFGLSYECYAKVKLPHIDVLSPENAKLIPGPGYYSVEKEMSFGKGKKHALLLGKGKTINDMIVEKAPPPNYYSPKNDIVSNGRYRNVGFGSSERNTFKDFAGKAPGPGSYNLKSKFDEIVEKNRFFKGFKEAKIV